MSLGLVSRSNDWLENSLRGTGSHVCTPTHWLHDHLSTPLQRLRLNLANDHYHCCFWDWPAWRSMPWVIFGALHLWNLVRDINTVRVWRCSCRSIAMHSVGSVSTKYKYLEDPSSIWIHMLPVLIWQHDRPICGKVFYILVLPRGDVWSWLIWSTTELHSVDIEHQIPNGEGVNKSRQWLSRLQNKWSWSVR